MSNRFERFLLDGGFTFDDEYIPPVWSILDSENRNSPITYLEFSDEYKGLCDSIVSELNRLVKED